MVETTTPTFENAHIFYGKAKAGKTVAMRQAITNALKANPNSTYAVLGDSEEYNFHVNGSVQKDIVLDVCENAFEIADTADIYIIPRFNYMIDVGFLNALAKTGKPVFTEVTEDEDRSVVEMLRDWKAIYEEDIGEPFMLETKIQNYIQGIRGVQLNLVSRMIKPEVFTDPATSFVYHECIAP